MALSRVVEENRLNKGQVSKKELFSISLLSFPFYHVLYRSLITKFFSYHSHSTCAP